MGDCQKTDKPSRYITNTRVNSAFNPCEVGKSSTACLAGIKVGVRSPVPVIPYGRWCSV